MRKRELLSRVLVVVGCLVLLVGLMVPAMGKRPTAEEVLVTMSYDIAGLATTCPGPLSMVKHGDGYLRADYADAGSVEVALPIAWSRDHPDSASGDSMSGCHGPALEGSGPGFEGYLILDNGPGGSLDLTSRFDYYWEYEYEVVKKGKSERTVQTQTVLEFFEINGNLTLEDGVFDWNAYGTPQTVSGDVDLLRFEKTAEIGAVWTTLDTTRVTITITIDKA